jgi:hypothetical protein
VNSGKWGVDSGEWVVNSEQLAGKKFNFCFSSEKVVSEKVELLVLR